MSRRIFALYIDDEFYMARASEEAMRNVCEKFNKKLSNDCKVIPFEEVK